jgi:hypothetical protein
MFAVSTAFPAALPAPMLRSERAAPGHPYDPVTQNGVEWQPGLARLWENGQITARATHATASPFEFWFWLQFADVFPQVTHWWFGSAWTGQVWLRAWPPRTDQPVIAGSLRFGDRAALEQPWQVQPGDPAQLHLPLPPLEDDRRNLPLQLALGQLVWEAATSAPAGSGNARPALSPTGAGGSAPGGTEPGRIFVTSLVAREALAAAFPLTPSRWYPAGIDRPLRQALCQALGLDGPAWLTTFQ